MFSLQRDCKAFSAKYYLAGENIRMPSDGAEMKITAVAKLHGSEWWYINDNFSTLLQWSNLNVQKTSRWSFKYIFTISIGIFSLFHHGTIKLHITDLE